MYSKAAVITSAIVTLGLAACGSTAPVAHIAPVSVPPMASGARMANVGCGGTLPARSAPSVAYDPLGGRVLLFGGLSAVYQAHSSPGEYCDDTWAWSGSGWTLLHPATHPSARAWAAFAFDYKTNLVVLNGGGTAYEMRMNSDEAWAWDGTVWKPVSGYTTDHTPKFDFAMASSSRLGMYRI